MEPCLCGDPLCPRCFAPRRRGRPKGIKRKRYDISLSAEENAIAKKIGQGNRSKGIAMALKAWNAKQRTQDIPTN